VRICPAASSYRQVRRHNKRKLTHQGEDGQSCVKPAIADEHCDDAQHQQRYGSEVIHRTERLKLWQALNQRVAYIDDKESCQEAKDPRFTGVEVIGEAFIVGLVVGEQQRAEQVQQDRVKRHKEVEGEGPLCDVSQPEPTIMYRNRNSAHSK
jgi:hypothetical protein